MTETQSAMVFLLLSGAYVIATPIAGKTVGQAVSKNLFMNFVVAHFVLLFCNKAFQKCVISLSMHAIYHQILFKVILWGVGII